MCIALEPANPPVLQARQCSNETSEGRELGPYTGYTFENSLPSIEIFSFSFSFILIQENKEYLSKDNHALIIR